MDRMMGAWKYSVVRFVSRVQSNTLDVWHRCRWPNLYTTPTPERPIQALRRERRLENNIADLVRLGFHMLGIRDSHAE